MSLSKSEVFAKLDAIKFAAEGVIRLVDETMAMIHANQPVKMVFTALNTDPPEWPDKAEQATFRNGIHLNAKGKAALRKCLQSKMDVAHIAAYMGMSVPVATIYERHWRLHGVVSYTHPHQGKNAA